ncbi:hypothetical protein JN11_03641 [Mucilaginibacter frigoritolerans]|jgi:hypothetical protein|uniref:Lipoprotein n=1 Tax=Mucilaginibacter frigoritolerans TaxID=652788 RepID=A0A562TU90_9SPHI|nr:hypothetical protein [Mucilaginibacter frigoritolerans]TWI97181.1 hypothetical protein JN11_03641 [Mucilaginibacter frigoritolerans]
MKKIYLVITVFVILTSCGSYTSLIKYQKLNDDVFANNDLKEYLQNNKSPKIVLRVPNSNDKATSNTMTNTNNDVLYNAIEKELLKEGFNVRDRGLFNEIVDKSKSADYSKLGEETNTDLILEVVNINTAVGYSTNQITLKNNGSGPDGSSITPVNYKRVGASIEFRLIMVKNNEIAGNYKYNYTPCINGCPLTDWTYNKHTKAIELKETVEVNQLEEFMKNCTQQLVQSFKS